MATKVEKNTRRRTEQYIDGPGMPARTETRSKRRWRQHARRRTSLLRFINAPLHVRRVIMSSPLSKELKAQYDVSPVIIIFSIPHTHSTSYYRCTTTFMPLAMTVVVVSLDLGMNAGRAAPYY